MGGIAEMATKIEEAMKSGDFGQIAALIQEFGTDDFVEEWPQSGELIRGKQNILELRLAFPTPPTATLRRIVGSGDLWVIEMLFDYNGDRYNTIVVDEYRDGLVVRETAYYGSPFEPPAWRANWVESASSSVSSAAG